MNQKGELTLDYIWHLVDAFLMFALGVSSAIGAAVWHSKVSVTTYRLQQQELTARVAQLERLMDMMNAKLDHISEEFGRRLEHLMERMDRLQG